MITFLLSCSPDFCFMTNNCILSVYTILHFFFAFTTFSHSMWGRCFGQVGHHADRSCASSTDHPFSVKFSCSSPSSASFLLSFYSPANPYPSCYPYTYPLLITCPYHFILLFCTSRIFLTLLLSLIISFLILSTFVIPHIHLHILIYANTTPSSIALYSAHDIPAMMYGGGIPYIIAGLISAV